MIFRHDSVDTIEFEKLKIYDYTAGQDLSSTIAEINLPASAVHKTSWSERSDKFYYVVNGTVTFIVNNETKTLSQGDVCIIPQGDRFSYRNEGIQDAKMVLLHTPGFKLECERFAEE